MSRQKWVRHPDNPILSLRPGHFDSNHIHAPMVIREGRRYHMWYSGSDLETNDHHMIGYAKSTDGISWDRLRDPVLVPPDPMGYYTTPAILRDARGDLLREDGKLRMWFTGKPFSPDLYMATSTDGVDWDMHSPDPIARGVYCPTVIYDEGEYRMWYTFATGEPFVIMHATSEDGVDWDLGGDPIMASTEPWEHKNMLYPFVLKREEYEMYYNFNYLQLIKYLGSVVDMETCKKSNPLLQMIRDS